MLFKLVPVKKIPKKGGYIRKAYMQLGDNFVPREIYLNKIKGHCQANWRLHKRAHLSIQVISGSASFLIASDPSGCAISPINLEQSSPWRLLIFPNSWFSFSSTSSSDLVLLCISDIIHDPTELTIL